MTFLPFRSFGTDVLNDFQEGKFVKCSRLFGEMIEDFARDCSHTYTLTHTISH